MPCVLKISQYLGLVSAIRGILSASNGSDSKIMVGSGRFVNMWLRSIHADDLDSFGVGCVITID